MNKVKHIQHESSKVKVCPECGASPWPEISDINGWLKFFKEMGMPICRKTFDTQVRPYIFEARFGNRVLIRGSEMRRFFNEKLKWGR